MSGKRANIFGQGKPETPYQERDDPADAPQRATAAQMASRKIKTAKPMRRPAGSSGSTPGGGLGAPQQSGFGFGGGGGDNNSSNPFSFMGQSSQGGNAFGGLGSGGAGTNSFPPAQSSAPSNSFANSSFPAFGGNNQNVGGFNPQPPSSGFNFSAASTGGSNPFGASAPAPTMNGTGSGAFSGSIFNTSATQSQPAFGGLQQNTATTGGFTFGATSSSAPGSASTAAPASQPSLFGSINSSAPASDSNPATAPSTNMFGFGTSAPASQAPATTTAQNMFGGFGTSTPSTAPAPAANIFSFGSTAAENTSATATAPKPALFGSVTSAAQDTGAATSTAASNPFAGLTAPPSTSSSPFSFGSTQKAPEPEKAPAPKSSLFSSVNATTQNSTPAAETPKANLFSFPSSTSADAAAKPAAPASGFSFLGTAQHKDKPVEPATSSSAETPKPNFFAGFGTKTAGATETSEAPPKQNPFNFSTPQPSKTSEVGAVNGGLFTAQPAKTNSGVFGQTFPPSEIKPFPSIPPTDLSKQKPKAEKQAPLPNFTQQTSLSANKSTDDAAPTEASNPFARLPSPTKDSAPSPAPQSQNLFSSQKTLAPPSEGSQGFLSRSPSPLKEPAPLSPASAMPTLTGAAATPKAAELPKIPKAHVPQEWAASIPPASKDQELDGTAKTILHLSAQLLSLNEKYRDRINSLPPMGDWSSLSLWHYKEAVEIKKAIDTARKQRAAAKGITGNESTLSTKRKVNEEPSSETQNATPSKKARGNDGANTPTSLPATETSKMFGSIMSNKTSAPPASNNLFNFKPAEKKDSEPPKPAPAVTGFVPTLPASNSAEISKSTPAFGFIPKLSTNSGASTGGGFLSQFSKAAKTYEQLRAERKQKAKDEDYDSDDETEAEWSARWDKEEEERKAAEDKAVKAAPGFTALASTKESDSPFNLFGSLSKAPSGASTPALFGSRVGSPAPSTTGGLSVFDTPGGTGQGSSMNIFAHLSSAPSSNNQDDESDEEERAVTSQKSPPPKRKVAESETESDDAHEGFLGHKKQETVGSKGSLLSRMTKADDAEKDESEKENDSKNTFLFGQANGTQTPSRVFAPFDFQGAGASTASPKSTSFGGDQTYKEGTPIKFSSSTTGQNAPLFQFQPATPSPAEFFSTTPTKPPPSTTFSFLQPNANQSGPASIAGSVLSSRAPTPLSEAESAKDSAAENDEEEGSKSEQLDLSQLTDDEKEKNEVIFHTEQAIAKQQVTKSDGTKAWENFARGPLWILKDKVTGKAFVRMRISSGATPLNYSLLPKLETKVSGSSGKMVSAVRPGKDGKLTNVFYAVKSREVAEDFSQKYNDCLPSS